MLDLREWLETLEDRGALRVLKGFHWDMEISIVSDFVTSRAKVPYLLEGGNRRFTGGREKGRKAFLFDDIVGYPSGYRVLTNVIPTPRLAALCQGLPETDSEAELARAVREKLPVWEASLGRFEPKVVKSGPMLENIDSGKDVNLFKFPAPKWHEGDAGRYIGTGSSSTITRDLDTGQINIGTYRIQIHDEKTVGIFIEPGKHGWLHIDKYRSRGEACPVVIVVGQHPLIITISHTAVQFPEYNFIGAISGEPVSVIKEEITGLPVPAASEIVIAGWSPPDKTRLEGPFGESGYYGANIECPFVEVERVYYRNNPIITGGSGAWGGMGMGDELLLRHLEMCGVPDVSGAHWEGHDWVVVSIKQRYAGHAHQALVAAQSWLPIANQGRFVVVVDEDIDPSNKEEVIWAILSRVDPEKDIDIIRRMWSGVRDPTIRHPTNAYQSSRALIDACRPYEWKDEFATVIEVSPELVERVRQKLQEID